MSEQVANYNLVLLCGKSATGKSLSLRNLMNPEGVWYANCESGKKLPFRSKFRQFVITDPYQIFELFTEAENHPEVHTIVIDSMTFLMEMFESVYVLNSSNTMKAWGDYAQYFKNLMQQYVAISTKNVIMTAHTSDVMNETEMTMDTLVKVKGSLMNQGIESFFSTVISSKKVPIKKLEGQDSKLLNITDEEQALGFKYVFQTKINKETVNERMRSSFGMWDNNETFIDNDMQLVLDRLHEYYNDDE